MSTTNAPLHPALASWLGLRPLLVELTPEPECEPGICSICGGLSDDLTGGWVGPWEEAVHVTVCPECRCEGDEP